MLHIYQYIDPQHLRLHLNFKKWHNNVPFYFIYILKFFMIIVININIIIFRIIIINTISVIITIIIFICLFIYLFIYSFIYLLIHSFFFLFFHILLCQQGSSPCIIALYNGHSKAPIKLSGRVRSCLVHTKPGMFGLGIVPKEIHSRLFNPISRLLKCLVFLFLSVIIVFVYDRDQCGTAATSKKEHFMITIYLFQSLLFVIGGFVQYVLAAPYPPLFYIFLL